MADICAVCDKKIGKFSLDKIQGVVIHDTCREAFFKNPEKYGAISVEQKGKENSETMKIQKEAAEQRGKEREEKSVYIKGGVNVESFDMPFGDMVVFMIKWALASIPAFIILAFIGAIFFAMFGALFVSTR